MLNSLLDQHLSTNFYSIAKELSTIHCFEGSDRRLSNFCLVIPDIMAWITQQD